MISDEIAIVFCSTSFVLSSTSSRDKQEIPGDEFSLKLNGTNEFHFKCMCGTI